MVVAGAAPTEAVAAAASTMAASTEAVVAAIQFGPIRSGSDQSGPDSRALQDWEASTDLVTAVASQDREQLVAVVVTVATAVAKFSSIVN